MLAALALALAAQAAPAHHSLHILLTTDEHGWILPLADKPAGVDRGGVINLFDDLVTREGYDPKTAAAHGFVLLSAGDMWTGPYESTVLEGAPMVAAMNRMGYRAAAVGNHEFDFGVRTISERAKSAQFPFLACNLVETATGTIVAWAKPFTIVDVDGLKLGIVGLTNVDSPVTADPRHMTGLKFLPYAASLDEWIPKARAAGADEIVVLIHESMSEEKALMPTFKKNHVRAVAMGHHHVQGTDVDDNGSADVDDDVVVCNAGAYMRSYCRIDLELDGKKLVSHAVNVKNVETPLGKKRAGDPALNDVVAAAEKSADALGGEVLVENVKPLLRGPEGPLGQLVVDAWLEALPYAQLAITNAGGLRQDLAAGPVKMRDVVSVLPFNNFLLVVDMTGAQLKETLALPGAVVAGAKFTFSEDGDGRLVKSVVDKSGQAIRDDAKLKVVINDFMYRGGDHYRFQQWDPEPEETAIDWREPVLRKLRELGKQKKKLDLTADDRAVKIKPQ
ncbi:MAG TPA: bifunctional UDP-sugar hydrolase/5'-nucleotidase [Myxococcota bacterium]